MTPHVIPRLDRGIYKNNQIFLALLLMIFFACPVLLAQSSSHTILLPGEYTDIMLLHPVVRGELHTKIGELGWVDHEVAIVLQDNPHSIYLYSRTQSRSAGREGDILLVKVVVRVSRAPGQGEVSVLAVHKEAGFVRKIPKKSLSLELSSPGGRIDIPRDLAAILLDPQFDGVMGSIEEQEAANGDIQLFLIDKTIHNDPYGVAQRFDYSFFVGSSASITTNRITHILIQASPDSQMPGGMDVTDIVHMTSPLVGPNNGGVQGALAEASQRLGGINAQTTNLNPEARTELSAHAQLLSKSFMRWQLSLSVGLQNKPPLVVDAISNEAAFLQWPDSVRDALLADATFLEEVNTLDLEGVRTERVAEIIRSRLVELTKRVP